MIPGGYILLLRKLFDSEFWITSPPLCRAVWVYLCGKAMWKDGDKLKRGQLITSYPDLKEAFSYMAGYRKIRPSTKVLRRACEGLRERHMIVTTKVTRGLLITIVNYDLYQTFANYEGHTEGATKGTTKDQRRTAKGHTKEKEGKEEKEGNEKKTSPAKPRRDQPIADAFTQAFNARFTEPYIVTRADMSQLNKLLGKRDSLTPERFVEVVTRHWDRGQFRPNASMSIKGACCAWSTLAAWQGNGQSGGNGGEHMTEIEVNRMYAKMLDEQPEPVETPEEMADRLEFKRNYPLRRDIG